MPFCAAWGASEYSPGPLRIEAKSRMEHSHQGIADKIGFWRDTEYAHAPLPAIADILGWGVDKGATTLLMPISSRRELLKLLDELAMKLSIDFYADSPDALLKGIAD